MAESQSVIEGDGSWLGIQLGDSFSSVQTALEKANREFEVADPNTIDLDDMTTYLCFESGAPSRLVLLVHESESILFRGIELKGLTIDEALEQLGVRSYDDTLWSINDIDFEWTQGARILDSMRPKSATPKELLSCGTLWIKSQGVGLVLHLGKVSRVAFCKVKHVPSIGCGPLDPGCLELVLSNDLEEELLADMDSKRDKPSEKLSGATRFVLFFLALGCILSPAIHAWIEQSNWLRANRSDGRVVAVAEGGLVSIEYTPSDITEPISLDVSPNYVVSQEINSIEPVLYSKKGDAYEAMTEKQAKDTLGHLNPGYAFFGLIVGVFLLFRSIKG